VKLHVKWDVISSDFHALVDACVQGITGTERHQELAKRLKDPNEPNKKLAKFGLIVNCVNCEEAVRAMVNTWWKNGSPVEMQLHDGKCPSCGSMNGFTYKELETFHA
jgi:rubrerythrin